MHRADRDTKYIPEDDSQLLSGERYMLLRSPDIVTQPVSNFSNSNCKMLITQCTELKSIVVTVYRPPVLSFALKSDSPSKKISFYLLQ